MSPEGQYRNLVSVVGQSRDTGLKFRQDGARTHATSTTMIRFGPHIRLTRRETERFKLITDLEPVGIRTLADLDAYIAQCKAHYWGVSRDTQFLHWLIDREYQQCRSAA
jgi:hypothetical protein